MTLIYAVNCLTNNFFPFFCLHLKSLRIFNRFEVEFWWIWLILLMLSHFHMNFALLFLSPGEGWFRSIYWNHITFINLNFFDRFLLEILTLNINILDNLIRIINKFSCVVSLSIDFGIMITLSRRKSFFREWLSVTWFCKCLLVLAPNMNLVGV